MLNKKLGTYNDSNCFEGSRNNADESYDANNHKNSSNKSRIERVDSKKNYRNLLFYKNLKEIKGLEEQKLQEANNNGIDSKNKNTCKDREAGKDALKDSNKIAAKVSKMRN